MPLALPLLDAMIPAATALAQTAAAPKLRAGFFYIPHGAIMGNTPYGTEIDAWTPSGAGADFKLSPILAPLETYKRYVTSFGNLENKASRTRCTRLNPATWLSAVRPDQQPPGAQHGDDARPGDRRSRSARTPSLPSLEVSSETTVAGGRLRRWRGACYYSSTLSFRNPTLAAADGVQPAQGVRAAVRRGRHARGEREMLARQTASMLDLHRRPHRGAAGTSSARRTSAVLDDYLETVREIERRVEKAKQPRPLGHRSCPNAPIGELDDFDEQVKLMFDLIALAYQADLTRVASYIMVAEGTNRTYNHIGVPDSFHPLSHHANDRERMRQAREDPDATTWSGSRTSSRSWRRRRTATARCSTTRCSCTART